ncbi:MAG: response regulator [Chloroflexi bacterium]|nr:response regulator [Chloroflexota bacterium]
MSETTSGADCVRLKYPVSPESRRAPASLLAVLGYRVSTASCGEEVIHHLKEHAVDLMVLDMLMPPGIDGAETYRRALEIRPGLRAIILSGFAESDRVQEAQTLGAGAFILKPVTLEVLAQAVREALDRGPRPVFSLA